MARAQVMERLKRSREEGRVDVMGEEAWAEGVGRAGAQIYGVRIWQPVLSI